MALSSKTMSLGQLAYTAFQQGDVATGVARLDQMASEFAPQMVAASPYEIAGMLAMAAKLYADAGQLEQAALKYADVCAFAEIKEPGTTATAGDFAELSHVRSRLGDLPGALHALERSAEHLKAAGEWSNYAASYENRIASLKEAVKRQQEPGPRSEE